MRVKKKKKEWGNSLSFSSNLRLERDLVRERGVRSGRIALVRFWTQPTESCCSTPHRTDESDAAAAALTLSLFVSLSLSLPSSHAPLPARSSTLTSLPSSRLSCFTPLQCSVNRALQNSRGGLSPHLSFFLVIYLFVVFLAVTEVF